ncbi:MAG: ABC transporter transmembrane domain-containing protein [Coprococcus sp.]
MQSVQENVSAIRVVKAYVREEQETSKFQYASKNIYDIFVRAEKNVIWNSPIMMFTVYTCIILISWFGAKMIVVKSLTTGELMSLLAYCMNILMSLMMLFYGICHDCHEFMASSRAYGRSTGWKPAMIQNPEHPLYRSGRWKLLNLSMWILLTRKKQ